VAESGVTRRVQAAGGELAMMVLEAEVPAHGAPDAILFLHPTNLDARCWLPVAMRLPNYRRILLDSRGHGTSHQRGPFRIADYAADVCEVLDLLALDTVHLVGGSLGGSIACAVAGAAPQRIASLVAVGAALEPADAATLALLKEAFASFSVHDIFVREMERETARGLSADLVAEVLQQVAIGRRSHELIREVTLNAFAEDARQLARDVRCPAWVLCGEFDESCPPAAGQRMAQSLLGRFEVLPGLGHLPMLQAPQLIAERLLENLREAQQA
jgi:pimeloyl-ACP methyl ester carboxylesterase